MKTNITNSLRWRKSAVNSGVAVLSVIIALAIARVLRTEYGFEPWNPFLCAIMFSAWFGGAMPGLVATGLSLLAFYYHFLAQAPSLGVESDLPRVLLALLTALFIVALSTAQRGAKAALHASERHFHSLFENMAESVVYFRMLFAAGRPQDAVYVEVNPAWKKLIGLTDIVGRRVSEVTPAIREPKSELFERSGRVALTGEAERFETYCASLKKWLSISAYCPKTEHVIAVIDDVTERKRADEVLRQNEFELAEAQRVAQIGSWAVDVATHTIRMSEELYRIFEVDKSTVDDKYEAFWSTVHLDDRGRVAQVIAEAKSTGQPYEVEFRIKTRSGQQKHIRALETLRRDGGGAVSVRFGIAQDITKQKEAEAAIRQAEQSIRLSIDAIPTMAWSVRPDGTVDFLNRRWLEYSGLSFEEYARDPMGPIHPADAPGIVERWRAHMAAGRYYEDEMRLRRADGEYRWFLIRTAPLHDDNGNIVKWFGSGVDIEDRKEAEEALRRSEQELRKREELYRLLTENANDFIRVHDPEARSIYGSPSVDWFYGQQPVNLFEFAHPEDLDRCWQWWNCVLAGNGERFVWRVRDRNGIWRWMETRASLIQHQGQPRVMTVCRDVTERKEAEEALRHSERQLHALVGRLNSVREDEAKRIARELHDDLGQKLTALNMELAQLGRNWTAPSPDQRAHIERMHSAVDQMIETVQAISSDLRLGQLDVLGLTAAIEWQLKEFSRCSNIPCCVARMDEVANLSDAQSTAVFRILQEALTNIARHAGATRVEVSLQAKPHELELKIRDNGRGITAAELDDRKAIGLLGMRERAQSVGGDITITGRAGMGTTVLVVIPSEGSGRIPS